MKNIGLSAIAVFGITASLFFGATAANAEVEDAVDAAIVDSSLTYLGLEEVSDGLTASLIEGMDAATDAGIVPDSLIDAVVQEGETAGEPEPTQTDAGTEPGSLDADLEQLFDEQLDLDQERWDEAGPLWSAAFETIRAEFDACRSDGQSASQCARTMAFSLQVAQAEALLEQLDQQLLAIAELPVEQQDQARADLEAERVALEARLVRAETRLASVASTQTGGQPERVVALLATVREKAQQTRGETSPEVGVVSPAEQQAGVAGASQQSQVPVPTQKPVTPNAGGASSTRPETPSTPGSQGNRSQTPGANAGNNGNAGGNGGANANGGANR